MADNAWVKIRRDSGRLARKRLRGLVPAVLLFGMVMVLTVAATLWAQRAVDRENEDRLVLQSEALVASIRSGAEVVELHLASLEGLFRASEEVTADEYAEFVADVGGVAGMGGLAYIPIVDAENLAAFVDQVAESIPGYEVFEIDADGNRVAVGKRDRYFPVEYFEPADALGRPLGLDAGSPSGRLPVLERAITGRQTVATPLVPLATTGQKGFVLYRPVIDTSGTVNALIAAPVVLTDLMADRVPEGLAEILLWTVRDVTDHVPGSVALPLDSQVPILTPIGEGMVYTNVVEVAGRIWQFDVAPAAGSPLLTYQEDTQILLVGLVVAILAAVAVYALIHRREAVAQLATAREVLEEKGTFLATVSHELRTPLTGVLGFAELLRDQGTGLSAEERTDLIGAIAEEASDLSGIIDDLVATGRAEHGTLTVVSVPVDLRAQTAQVLEELGLTIRIPVEITQPAPAIADPGRVRQIIRNLTSNAVRYGGPNIRVVIDPLGKRLAIEVIDDGAGIAPEHGDKIFEPYYRAHNSEGTTESMGLGLNISRTLAQHMGGDLTYRRAGSETIFQLTLPAAELPNTEPGTAEADTATTKTRQSEQTATARS